MAMAKPKDICHRRNCRGTRGTTNHLWSQCIFNPLKQQQQNVYQPNSGKPYPDGRIRGQFRGDSRGKNYPGTNNINSNNIMNSGQKPSGIRYGNQQGQFRNYSGSNSQQQQRNWKPSGNQNTFNGQRKPSSQHNNFAQGDKVSNLLNVHNNRGLVKNNRGKWRSPAVTSAMVALKKDNLELAKKFSRDINSALCVENLSAQLSKTGDIGAFKEGLEHLHEVNFSVGSSHHQKHDTSFNMEEPQRFDANVAQVRFSDGSCKDCGRNIIHRDGICDMAYVTRDSMYSNQANLASQDRHRYIRDHRKEEDRDCAYMFNYQLQILDHHIDDII